jgi:Chaperone of endosialidase
LWPGPDPGYSCNLKSTMKIEITLSVLIVFALSPIVRAVSPAPDGVYPGGNTAEGQNALLSLTSGTYNTGVGLFSLLSNASGNFNTATGAGALLATTADENTAIGAAALLSNTTGEANAAHGAFALFNNTEGSNNTANGPEALFSNKTGRDNTATGAQALFFNDGDPSNNEGSENSAFGNGALFGNTTGYANSAFGSGALDLNNSGRFNTAIGFHAMGSNFALGDGAIATGDNNTALGALALSSNIEGDDNTAVGDSALFNNADGESNTAVGGGALANNTSGFANTAIGFQALPNCSTGSGNIGVGQDAGFNVSTASNVICIGIIGGDNIDNGCYIANIYSNIQPVIGTDPDYVTIASNGKLGRSNLNGSSRRFKHDIQPMDTASEVIFALKPVSFRYNKEYDPAERPSFGLIAEDVADLAPDLVGRNKKGEPESVRYEQINAMLLNEFLKEHRRVQEQEASIMQLKSTVSEQEATIARQSKNSKNLAARQQKEIEALTTQLKEQAGQIQRVSARVKLKSPATNVVLDNR